MKGDTRSAGAALRGGRIGATEMRIDMCIDTCIDACPDVQIDIHMYKHVYRHSAGAALHGGRISARVEGRIRFVGRAASLCNTCVRTGVWIRVRTCSMRLDIGSDR